MINHLHIHIIPRSKHDELPNSDEIYRRLELFDDKYFNYSNLFRFLKTLAESINTNSQIAKDADYYK